MLHQRLDHFRRAGGHAVGQFLHGDLFGQDDVAHDLHLIGAQPLQFRLAALAFALAADRGEASGRFSSSPSMAACTSMRPARRRSSVPFLGAATGGLRGRHAAGAGRRTGRASSSSSGRRAAVQAQRLAGRRAGCARRPARRGLRLRRGAGRGAATAVRRLRAVGGRRSPADGAAPAAAAAASPRASPRPRALRPAPRRRGGPLPRRPCALLPRAGVLPRRRRGSKSSPARAARPRAWRIRAAARPARAGGRPVRSRSARGRRRPAAGRLRLRRRAWPRGAAPAPAGAAAVAHRRPARGLPGDGRARLAHLHLHDLGAAVAEALPHGAGIDGPPQLQASRRTQREPALAAVLIVAFAHAYPLHPLHRSPAAVSRPWPRSDPHGPCRTPFLSPASRPLRRRAARPTCPAQPRHAPRGPGRTPRPAPRPAAVDHRQLRPAARQEARTLRRAAVRRPARPAGAGQSCSHSRAFSKPATACPARRARPSLADPPDQRRLQQDRKIGGHRHRAARRPACAKLRPASAVPGGFYCTSPRRAQPYSPPGSRAARSGTIARSGPDDEADHPLLRQPLARDHAAPQRPGFGRRLRHQSGGDRRQVSLARTAVRCQLSSALQS